MTALPCVGVKPPSQTEAHVAQDETESRKQFHCQECGLCRIGGRESFFHCPTCGCCYSTSLQVLLQGMKYRFHPFLSLSDNETAVQSQGSWEFTSE